MGKVCRTVDNNKMYYENDEGERSEEFYFCGGYYNGFARVKKEKGGPRQFRDVEGNLSEAFYACDGYHNGLAWVQKKKYGNKTGKKPLLFAVGDGNHSFAAAKECYDKYHKDRYILAEIINLYDEGLLIEPIHRLVYNADIQKLQKDLDTNTPLQELQPKLDKWLEENGGSLEYIHGKPNCERLAKEKNGLAITWDKFSKETLFS